MKKISLVILAFSMLFCACIKEDDDYVKLSSQETEQYREAIAGSYSAKGYTILIDQNDFNNYDVIGKQTDIDDIFIDIDNNIEQSMVFWHVPVNTLANLLPENSGARKVLEESGPISFTTTYGFESAVSSLKGEKMVNWTFKSVPHYFTTTYDGKNHQITINIQPCGIYLPYTSDTKAVRNEFLKSQIRFDITSMEVDGEEYKHFDLIVATEISKKSEQ